MTDYAQQDKGFTFTPSPAGIDWAKDDAVAAGDNRLKPALITLPFILALLTLAVISFRWSLADIYATQIDYHLQALNNGVDKRSVKDWRQAEQYLQQVLAIRPSHPQYLETAEHFYQTLDTIETDAPAITDELGWKQNETQALKYAELGLQAMPSWPYLWKQLALSKIALGQIDQELAKSYGKAFDLGPWEQGLQLHLAAIALNNWDKLNITTQQFGIKAIDRTVAINPNGPNIKLMTDQISMIQACIMLKTLPPDQYPTLNTVCQTKLAENR